MALMMVFVHFCSVYLHRVRITTDISQYRGVLVSRGFYKHVRHKEGVVRSGDQIREFGG